MGFSAELQHIHVVPGASSVNVFSFDDYRALSRALYAHKKASEYGFSHRAFSRRAGLKSTNFLKLVMDGQRNLSPEAAQRFAAAHTARVSLGGVPPRDAHACQ